MPNAFATVNGQNATRITLHVPQIGPWFADVELESDPALSGRVTIALGAASFVGTVAPQYAGTFGLQRKLRVVAGAGGWSSLLRSKDYHNDAGLRASIIASDAAREAGETLGDFAPEADRLGEHFVREAGPAAQTLEAAIGAAAWWVAYDGTTHVGARASSAANASAYEVLEHDPRTRTIVLAVDDVRAVGIGSILSERLDAAQTVRELEIDVSVQGVRVKAWCGGSASTASRLTGAIRAIIASATDGKIYGLRKYRVTQMSADRVELQVVRRDAGLPDILPISMWPGLAGAHAALTPGAEVLVEFIDGEPTDPVITHFAGKGGAGFVPVSLAISVSSLLKLGDESATDFVALASKVDAAVNAIVDTVISPGDGGAAIKTAVTSAWSGVGSSSAATKVKAA